jgi:hypothetical protein
LSNSLLQTKQIEFEKLFEKKPSINWKDGQPLPCCQGFGSGFWWSEGGERGEEGDGVIGEDTI